MDHYSPYDNENEDHDGEGVEPGVSNSEEDAPRVVRKQNGARWGNYVQC